MKNDLGPIMGDESRACLDEVTSFHDAHSEAIRTTDPETVEATLFSRISRCSRQDFPWEEELSVLPPDLAATLADHRRSVGVSIVAHMGASRRQHPSEVPPVIGVFLGLGLGLALLFLLSEILGNPAIILFCLFGPALVIAGAVVGTKISRQLHRNRPRPEEEAEREIIQNYHDLLVDQYCIAVESLAAALIGDLVDQGYRTWERELHITRVDTWTLSCLTNKGQVVICGDMCDGRITSSLADPQLVRAYQEAAQASVEWNLKDVRDLTGDPAKIMGRTVTGIWA